MYIFKLSFNIFNQTHFHSISLFKLALLTCNIFLRASSKKPGNPSKAQQSEEKKVQKSQTFQELLHVINSRFGGF